MGFSDGDGPLEVFALLPFRLLLLGLTLEGESLLELLGDVEGIEVSRIPGDVLKEGDRCSASTTGVRY